ncbi:MAG: LLM class flavin-dependent oxidoreductase [Gammaproteobacteria bacterium]|nr:LLM class flavin-dependent oxidoreductase [Gammaproteobacteria bacterium]MDG1951868.1 LLM class flavin-dependent oxidoreductase [Gammaproteobacteria bacterium]
MTIKISVLDQSPIRSGSNASEALNETIDLARLSDKLGFHRFWVSEHHASAALAGCSPEVLLGRLGAETESIRIGSGGIMLPHYSPYKVAENFKVLETLYPGRIDLGIGRAPGTDPFTSAAIRYGSTTGPQHFPNMVCDLQSLLNDDDPITRGMERARAYPKTENPPALWMLGSSEDSALLAGTNGLPYNFAYFINPNIRKDIFEIYRDQFQPGPNLNKPQTCLTLFSITASSEEEAQYLAKSRDLWYVKLLQGNPGPFPTPEEAESYTYSPGERELIMQNQDKRAVGTPQQVSKKLKRMAEDFNADEIMLVSITHDPKARRRSYELIANEWELYSTAA